MKILVIKPSSLGDIIHGLLVAESIRQQVPDAQIDWVARDIFLPLVEACDTVRRVYPFYRGAGPGAFGQLIMDLRETPYDWVLDLQGLARSGVMTQFSGAPRSRRIGRSDARECSVFAYGKKVKLPQGDEPHAVDILREFLPALGLQNELRGRLTFKRSTALPKLPERYVLLFPGSRRAEKEWPGFAELTELLIQRRGEGGAPVLWAGDVPAVARDWPREQFFNLTAKTALEALPTLIDGAALTVCNDSGPMHLAAAMGKPVLGLFGPTSPRRFGPYPPAALTNAVLEATGGDLSQLSAEAVLAAMDRLAGTESKSG